MHGIILKKGNRAIYHRKNFLGEPVVTSKVSTCNVVSTSKVKSTSYIVNAENAADAENADDAENASDDDRHAGAQVLQEAVNCSCHRPPLIKLQLH